MQSKKKKIHILHNGEIKNVTLVGEVPSLWGGSLPVVKVCKKEMTIDPKTIVK